ncbi:hypothetical protein LTR56_008661 [Elasticomyces elasticus]|nr:hypothetical protein LTR22_022495 [Elasticomyces elasticus]KAK3646310.1 hypothetical protein LTR56_008661 [Elasticomyces elasticus]KAK4916709.1 hypothetical protein LTR49_015277 [Elasticomyces elasticus]KAK5768030.1 hypothetical protein LTS12_001847 [Elasticomyces elasticus]
MYNMYNSITSFEDARKIINDIAVERAARFAQDEDVRPLDEVVGRTVRENLDSPISTPTFDSVAIEGYAVIASLVSYATPQRPVKLRVMGIMTAGDRVLEIDDTIYDGMVCCVEVEVGAAFPTIKSSGQAFDAIVPREHATIVAEGGSGRILQVDRMPLTSWHKRIAGSDFREGDRILDKGTSIAPKYVLALASVGVQQVSVTRQVRVGVVSIGSELVSTIVDQHSLRYKIPDANGPYLTAAVRETGEDAVYLGSLPDNADVVTAFIRDKLENDHFDVFITTGGLATRTPDCVETAIRNLAGNIHFQNVAIQPGGSLLFASLPESDSGLLKHSPSSNYYGSIHGSNKSSPNSWSQSPPKPRARGTTIQPAIFSLPGSPIASACCFRFLVTPYIRALIGMQPEQAILAKVAITNATANYRQDHSMTGHDELVVDGSNDYDIFRHAVLKSHYDGVSVEIAKETTMSKASPFASSNCWLHVPRGHVGIQHGEAASIFPFCSPKS